MRRQIGYTYETHTNVGARIGVHTRTFSGTQTQTQTDHAQRHARLTPLSEHPVIAIQWEHGVQKGQDAVDSCSAPAANGDLEGRPDKGLVHCPHHLLIE